MKEAGTELSPEEMALALSRRPKNPLNNDETDDIREVLEWFRSMKEDKERKQIAREARAKRYPLIFGLVSTTVAVVSAILTLLHWKP